MWLCATSGVFHLTRQGPGEYFLQAQSPPVLESLRRECGLRQPVVHDDQQAVPYHLAVTPAEVLQVLAHLDATLDPEDLADQLDHLQGEGEPENLARKLWGIMVRLQQPVGLQQAMTLTSSDLANLHQAWPEMDPDASPGTSEPA